MATQEKVYKGKVTNRSWAQLPDSLVRYIGTFFLANLARSACVPAVWQHKAQWHARILFTALRDAIEVERFMRVCPQWGRAMEMHPFWQHASSLLDPPNICGQHIIHATSNNNSSSTDASTRITPFQHFFQIRRFACVPCRLSSPDTHQGVGHAKSLLPAFLIPYVPVCKRHANADGNGEASCGVCLRSGGLDGTRLSAEVGCQGNEDDETWPNVETTCISCRKEAFWNRVRRLDPQFQSDWPILNDDRIFRLTLDNFLEAGEGDVANTIQFAHERIWLRKHTKLDDLASQLVAATKLARNDDNGMDLSDFEDDEDDDEDGFEDPVFLARTEESVRDYALGDWARSRIMDGHWISPADIWYQERPLGGESTVKATRPCGWLHDEHDDTDHPLPETLRAPVPPSFSLCEQAFRAYNREMSTILLPPMKNVVRKLIIECGASGVDPAMQAARWKLEEVLQALREDMIWFDGVDWLERRKNEGDGSDDSTCSSNSGSGSPVMSTSTHQTTPSPPPADSITKSDDEETTTSGRSRKPTIAVDPVLSPPRELSHIPYVPTSIAHFPNYTLEQFRVVWREACAPLYHCRCSICERANVKIIAEQAATVIAQSQGPQAAQAPAPQLQPSPIILQSPNPQPAPPPANSVPYVDPLDILQALEDGNWFLVDARKCSEQQLRIMRTQGVVERLLTERLKPDPSFPWLQEPQYFEEPPECECIQYQPTNTPKFNSPDPYPDAPGLRFLPQPWLDKRSWQVNIFDGTEAMMDPHSLLEKMRSMTLKDLYEMKMTGLLAKMIRWKKDNRKRREDVRESFIRPEADMFEPKNYEIKLHVLTSRQTCALRDWGVLPEIVFWQEDGDGEEDEEEEDTDDMLTADSDNFGYEQITNLRTLGPAFTSGVTGSYDRARSRARSVSPPFRVDSFTLVRETFRQDTFDRIPDVIAFANLMKGFTFEELLTLHDDEHDIVRRLLPHYAVEEEKKEMLAMLGDEVTRDLDADIVETLKDCDILPLAVAQMPRKAATFRPRKTSTSSTSSISSAPSRKRSLDGEELEEDDQRSLLGADDSTPTKRVRMHEPEPSLPPNSPLRKRSSEEIEISPGDDNGDLERKRARHSPSLPPTSDSESFAG